MIFLAIHERCLSCKIFVIEDGFHFGRSLNEFPRKMRFYFSHQTMQTGWMIKGQNVKILTNQKNKYRENSVEFIDLSILFDEKNSKIASSMSCPIMGQAFL